MTKSKASEKPTVERRTVSLVRIEAAYGPIYLVVDNHSNFAPDTPDEKVLDWSRFCVEGMGEPEITFRNVLAVVRAGRCCSHDVFTHVRAVEVPLDYNFEKEVHRTKDGVFKMFPEAHVG